MKEKINLQEELSRIKNLFGYERGVVISEQIPYANAADVQPFNPTAQFAVKSSTELPKTDFSKFPCLNSFKTENKQVSKLGKDTMEELKIGVGSFKQYMFGADGTLYSYGAEYGKWSCGTKPNIININGKDVSNNVDDTPKTNVPKTNTPKTTTQKSNYLAPQELRQNVGNKTGVQAFQDWLDTTHSGWHTKYQKLGGDVSKGYGIFGPMTNAAWGTYKKEYLDKNPNLAADLKTLPLTPTTDATAQPGQTAAQSAQPVQAPQLANATPKNVDLSLAASTTPEKYYKQLYDTGLIQGEPSEGGDNRIRYKGPELNKEQQEMLTKAMDGLGYEFLRKGYDKRLVYRKK